MKFKVNKVSDSPELNEYCTLLIKEVIAKGNEHIKTNDRSDFVLNLIDLEMPKAFKRTCQEEMVVSIALMHERRIDLKSVCYTALIKSISNILFCIVLPAGEGSVKGYSITPEAGFTEFLFTPAKMFNYMYPIISSHFVIRNKLSAYLVLEPSQKIPEIDNIIKYSKELKEMGVLPAPFPLSEFLDQDLINQLFRLYQIKGLSYGNLSIRNKNYENGGTAFWMTARGVDKSRLKGVGKDILLVTGYDNSSNEMLINVTPDHDPQIRVSVDAIEHYKIYREFPGVCAIVHVHAWMEHVICTNQAFPCGTMELADAVVSMLKRTPAPGRAEIGLKNHGLTITGPDIEDIFDRIRERLIINVPMFD